MERRGREGDPSFRMGQMLGSPISAENLYATEVIVNVFDGGPKTKVVLTRPDLLARDFQTGADQRMIRLKASTIRCGDLEGNSGAHAAKRRC